MSRTKFVEYRGRGFWAYDVALAIFLKHLIDAAETRSDAWLVEAVRWWRVVATVQDYGLEVDASWSPEQIDSLVGLADQACNILAQWNSISQEEINSWTILDDLGIDCRGASEVATDEIIELGRAIIALARGSLANPPPGTIWCYGFPGGRRTLESGHMGASLLGFSDQWLRLGLLTEDELSDQLHEYEACDDKNTEHYRYRVFRKFLASHRPLPSHMAEALYELGRSDPDLAMGGAMMGDVVDLAECPDAVLEKALSSDRSHLPKMVKRRRLRTELNSGLTEDLFTRCLAFRDSYIHRELVERADLSRAQLEQLAAIGSNRAVRNIAKKRLRGRYYALGAVEINQLRRDEDERYLRAVRKYTVSYMSNSKWRKLFTTIDEAGIKIEEAVWRFIDSDRAFDWGWPAARDLDETHLKDGRFQPIEYRWIESIFVPRTFQPDPKRPAYLIHQDTDEILDVLLRRVGDFMIEEAPEGIMILGYGGRR